MSTERANVVKKNIESEVKVNTTIFNWRIKNLLEIMDVEPPVIITSEPVHIESAGNILTGYFDAQFLLLDENHETSNNVNRPKKGLCIRFIQTNVEGDFLNPSIEYNIICHSKMWDFVYKAHFNEYEKVCEYRNMVTDSDLRQFSEIFISKDTLMIQATITAVSCNKNTEKKDDGKCAGFKNNDNNNQLIEILNTAFNLSALWKKDQFSDIALATGDLSIPAHKAILAAKSSVFMQLFQESPNQTVLTLPEMEPATLKSLIEFIYTGKVDNVDDAVAELLIASEKYQIMDLKIITQKLLCDRITMENAADLVVLADTHDAQILKLCVLSFIRNSREDFIKSEDCRKLIENHPKIMYDIFCDFVLREM